VTITENYKSTTDSKAGDSSSAVPDEMIDAVMAGVDAGGLELLGPNGVLADLTKRLIERGLSEELGDHLGYEAGDVARRGSGKELWWSNYGQLRRKTGAGSVTATPLASPPPSSSSADSSTIATDGAPHQHLSAQVLRTRADRALI